MGNVSFNLSWPSKDLSSNSRVHWSRRSGAVKAYRAEAWAMAMQSGANGDLIRFEYHPPDMRRRDAQNMPHMLKAAIDGMADAMGRDDSNFECAFPSKFSTVIPGGRVVVTVTPNIVNVPIIGTIS